MEKNVKANAIENELGVDVAKETRRLHEEGSFKRTLEIAQERRTQQTSSKEGVNQALCESFREWIRIIWEIEDQREEPRYAAQEYATPSEKMMQYFDDVYRCLDQNGRDILTMILSGELLYPDQLYGKGLFDGVGLMAWRFSLSADYFVPDEVTEVRKKERKSSAHSPMAKYDRINRSANKFIYMILQTTLFG